MSEEGMDIFFNMAIVGVVFCSIILLLSPSPMQICIKYGYEYTDGNCEKGLTNE